jgi:hypothetical protein
MSEYHNESSAAIFAKYAKPVCDISRMNLWAEMLMDGASATEMLLEFPSTDIWVSSLRRRSHGAGANKYHGQSLVCSGASLIWVTPTITYTHAIFSRRHKALILSPITNHLASLLPPLVGVLRAWGTINKLSPLMDAEAPLNRLKTIDASLPFRNSYDKFDAAALQLTVSMDLLLNIEKSRMEDPFTNSTLSMTHSLLLSVWWGSKPWRDRHGWPSPRDDDPEHVKLLTAEQFLVRGLKHYGQDSINLMIEMAEQYGYPEDALGKALLHMSKFQSY